jgi:hypothetical protein
VPKSCRRQVRDCWVAAHVRVPYVRMGVIARAKMPRTATRYSQLT